MAKTSFVFHTAYISDIPEELQPTWAMYVIKYATTDEEPTFDDWRDLKNWKTIKGRIDADFEAYEKRVMYQKVYREQKKAAKTSNNLKSNEVNENILSENEKNKNILSEREVNENVLSETANAVNMNLNSEFYSEFEFVSEFDATKKTPSKTTKKAKQNKSDNFVKPTQEEIAAYCKEKGYTFSPLKFFMYYDDPNRDWYYGTGKNKHRIDWKRACVTWNETDKERGRTTSPPISNNANTSEFEDYFLNKGENGDANNNAASAVGF